MTSIIGIDGALTGGRSSLTALRPALQAINTMAYCARALRGCDRCGHRPSGRPGQGVPHDHAHLEPQSHPSP